MSEALKIELEDQSFFENRKSMSFQQKFKFAEYIEKLDQLDKAYCEILAQNTKCLASQIPMRPCDVEVFNEYMAKQSNILAEFNLHLDELNLENTFEYPEEFTYLKKYEGFYTDFLRTLVQSKRCILDDRGPRCIQEDGKIYLEKSLRSYFFNCQKVESNNERVLEMHIYAYLLYINRSDYSVEEKRSTLDDDIKHISAPESIQKKHRETAIKEREIALRASDDFNHYLKQASTEVTKYFALGCVEPDTTSQEMSAEKTTDEPKVINSDEQFVLTDDSALDVESIHINVDEDTTIEESLVASN